MIVDVERQVERGENPLGDGDGFAERRIRREHRELVAAEAREQIGPAQAIAQPLGRLHEQQVAVMMAETVVDDLEAVQVDEHHRHLPAVLAIGAPLRLQPMQQVAAVGQPGQRVVRILVDEARVRVVEFARADLHAFFEFDVRRMQRFGGAAARERGVDVARHEREQFLVARRIAHERRVTLHGQHAAHVVAVEERNAEPRTQAHVFVAGVDHAFGDQAQGFARHR